MLPKPNIGTWERYMMPQGLSLPKCMRSSICTDYRRQPGIINLRGDYTCCREDSDMKKSTVGRAEDSCTITAVKFTTTAGPPLASALRDGRFLPLHACPKGGEDTSASLRINSFHHSLHHNIVEKISMHS